MQDTLDDLVSVPSVRRTLPSASPGYFQTEASPCNRALTFRRQTDHFDYFLCHKKQHSKLGGVPEQIAKNLHDALEILGYKGFFDTDDLEEVSRESIAENLRKSKTMIVFMTDETMDSEWCKFEWETANALDIPIKVVVDLAHFLKGDVVDQFKGGQYQFLLNYQWIEYTDSTRRMTVQYLAGWLGEEFVKKVASRRPSREFMYDTTGSLCVRDNGDTLKLFHPLFEGYMVASGLAYNIDAWSRPVRAWVPVVRCLSLACFGICLWRLIYATGPAYTDWYSCLYVVCIHLFLFHGVVRTTGLLSSDVMKTLLEHTASGDLAGWTARRVYKASWWAAIIGLSLGIAASISMIVIYLPLFLSSVYMSTATGMAFGICSAIFFTSVAPVVLIQEFAVLTLLYIIAELSYHDFEAAICSLHELLPTVGLHQFVQAGSNNQIRPTSAQLSKFSKRWSNAFALKLTLERYINPVFYVHFFFNLLGLMIPVVYTAADRFYLELDLHWVQLAKPFMWWGYAALCYSGTVVLPAASCHSLEDIADHARCLNTVPKTKEFLLTSLQVDLSWRILPLKVTPFGGLVLLAPLFGSAVCWAHIFGSLA